MYHVIKLMGKRAFTAAIMVLLFGSLIPYVFFLICWISISWLFPKSWFYKFEDILWGWFQRFVVFFFEHLTGVEVYVDGPIPAITENCLAISNHQCTLDWIVADFIALRQKVAEHTRYVFKNICKYYPLCGFGFGVHGGVFVKRDGTYNDANTRQVLKMLMARKATIYYIIYPEGTRYRPGRNAVLKKSQDFAAKMNLKILKQVLSPRVKAFDTALSSLKNYIDAVYDITVIYDPMKKHKSGGRAEPPTVWDFLCGDCKRIYVSYQRIPIDEVLSSIDKYQKQSVNGVTGSMKWLHERFEIKDELFHTFYTNNFTDSLSDESSSSKSKKLWRRSNLSLSETVPSLLLLIMTHTLFLYFSLGRLIYLVTILGGCSLGVVYCHFMF